MSYVVFDSTEHRIRDRRSPLERFGNWCFEKAAGTILEKPLHFLVYESFIGRVAVSVTATLVVGAFVDSFAFHNVESPHNFAVCAVLGALSGIVAQGAGGAVVGFVWGLLVGEIFDSMVSEIIYDQTAEMVGTMAAWCVAVALGWFAGRIAFHCYEKWALEHRRTPWTSKALFNAIVLTYALVQLGIILCMSGMWLIENPRWGITMAIWGSTIGVPIYFLLERHVLYPRHYRSFPSRKDPELSHFFDNLVHDPNFDLETLKELSSCDRTGALIFAEAIHNPSLKHHIPIHELPLLDGFWAFIRRRHYAILGVVWVISILLCGYQLFFSFFL